MKTVLTEKSRFVNNVMEQSYMLLRVGGFSHMSLKNISSLVGFSKSRIYNYFGGRFGILDMLIEDTLSQIQDQIILKLPVNKKLAEVMTLIIYYRNTLYRNHDELLVPGSKLLFKERQQWDRIIEEKEDKMLIHLLCNYYDATSYTPTVMGFDFEHLWTILLPYETRKELTQIYDYTPLEVEIQNILGS